MKKLCVELSKHVISNTSLACFSFADNLRVADELLVAPVFPQILAKQSAVPISRRKKDARHGRRALRWHRSSPRRIDEQSYHTLCC